MEKSNNGKKHQKMKFFFNFLQFFLKKKKKNFVKKFWLTLEKNVVNFEKTFEILKKNFEFWKRFEFRKKFKIKKKIEFWKH